MARPAHSLLGWTVQQEWESGRSLAEVQKKVYQTLHTDGMGAGHGLHGLGLLYGAEADMPEHQPLSLISYPLDQVKNYPQLDPKLADKDIRAQNAWNVWRSCVMSWAMR